MQRALCRAAQRSRSLSSSRRHASTLLVAEHDGTKLSEGTLAAITACAQMKPITLLVGGSAEMAATAAKADGVDAVQFVDNDALNHGVAEEWAPLVEGIAKTGFTHVVAGASSFSKGLFPRVSALLDVAQVSDIIDVKSEDTFVRPIYAGNALATVKSEDAIKVVTVRPTAFDKAAAEGGSAAVSAAAVDFSATGTTTWVSEEVAKSDRPELASAKTVISGGRGLKTGDNFAMLDSLALKLNAAVGASRAAVDSGMCPNDMQVGQTGKVVAPDLYVAVGISGAIQHLAGMKDSKTIVAINKDPEAPIFQVADYGLVDDLFKAVPELESKLP
jgi:electron transfer flavoprotein alpha subunit